MTSHDGYQKSLLTQENQSLLFKGRQLHVLSAVNKEDLDKLKETKKQNHYNTVITDKRNLHLVKEGVIQPESPMAQGLSKMDLMKRKQAELEKKTKLKNPHYGVSDTRLCFRNLPLNVDEKRLKDIVKHAVAERGLQEDCPEKDMSKFHSKVVIRQVKIVRSKDRVDTKGVLRSKGYAFVEFSEHAHALACLHQLNNNPNIFGDKKRPIIEFAIDNLLILKKRDERNKRQKVKPPIEKNPMNHHRKVKEQQSSSALKKKRPERVMNSRFHPSKTTKMSNVAASNSKTFSSAPTVSVAMLAPPQKRSDLKEKAISVSDSHN
jgi:nucleolar protein 4